MPLQKRKLERERERVMSSALPLLSVTLNPMLNALYTGGYEGLHAL
jgi:hypothetical protein